MFLFFLHSISPFETRGVKTNTCERYFGWEARESPAYLNRWTARVTPMPDCGFERCSPSHDTHTHTHLSIYAIIERVWYDLVTCEGTPWDRRRT